MKLHKLLIVSLCITVVGLGSLLAFAGREKKTGAEFRNQFVKNFKRTGLNTTVGDAMMLRILVESSRLKRGVEVGSATGFGAVNMGIAFERTGGHLYTIDIDPNALKIMPARGVEDVDSTDVFEFWGGV